jgi:predicted ester cyclase
VSNERRLSNLYLNYLDCLNRRDWASLGHFVADNVVHNERLLGLPGYRAMLEDDVREIPDLRFDCTPRQSFLGLPVGGRRIRFTENVFYAYREGKIAQVWSIIDKAAIEAQLET